MEGGADWGVAAGAPVDAASVPTSSRSADRVVTAVIAVAAVVLLVVIGLIAYTRRPRQDAGSPASAGTSMRCRPSPVVR